MSRNLMSREASSYPLPTPTLNTNQTCASKSAIKSHRSYTCWKAFTFVLFSSSFISDVGDYIEFILMINPLSWVDRLHVSSEYRNSTALTQTERMARILLVRIICGCFKSVSGAYLPDNPTH